MTQATRKVEFFDADIRLDRWFKRNLPAVPHGMLVKWLRTGQVRVDGKRAEAGTRLVVGAEIRIPPMPLLTDQPKPEAAPRPVTEEDARDLKRSVLYQDESVIVLNKPYGLAVQGGPGITKHLDGMLDALANEQGERPRLIHRLDRDTSGVLVLGRTAQAASRLAAAFRGRDAQKLYWAVVAGRPVPVEGRLDLALGKEGSGGQERMVPQTGKNASHAATLYRTLDHAARKLAWLELIPLTGRTHQLRVHCKELGAPILGDGKYGGAAAHVTGLVGKMHLHARKLSIPHPEGGWLTVEAPLPPHMQATFTDLGFTATPPKPPLRSRAAPEAG